MSTPSFEPVRASPPGRWRRSPFERLSFSRLVLLFTGLILVSPPAWAERLPIRAYGSNEGLAGDHVRFILQDSHRLLWLATNAGVSSFDGHEFRNYGAAEGLPFPSARKVVEAPDGVLYALARGRVARMRDPSLPGQPAFEPFSAPELSDMVGDVLDITCAPDGALVIAGWRGAARFITRDGASRFERIDLGPAPGGRGDVYGRVWGVAFDATGALWAARTLGITRVGPDGRPRTLTLSREHQIESGWGWLPSMVSDRSGRVWLLTTGSGVWRLEAGETGDPAVSQVLDRRSGFPSDYPRGLHEASDGTLWIGTTDRGLVRCEAGSIGRDCTALGTAQGLPDTEAYGVTTDSQGNLWWGTLVAGIAKMAADGLTSWREADGLRPPTIYAMHDDPDEGVLFVLGSLRFASLRDARSVASWQVVPALARAPGWGVQQLLARGRDGRLWLATGGGAAVYPAGTRARDLATRQPTKILTTANGLPGNGIHRIFAARDGAIWAGILYNHPGLCRISGADDEVRCFGPADGLPEQAAGVTFEQDAAGSIWVGLYEGGLFRYRSGRFESWPEVDAERQTMNWSIRRDAAGRLWVTGVPGLLRIDAPESDHPSFHRYTSTDGLSAAETMATAEDEFGRVYVSGLHGVDCLDLSSGAVRTFTTADGLPSNRAGALHRDRNGVLWIGTSHGVARLVPRAARSHSPPLVFLAGMTVAGTRRDSSLESVPRHAEAPDSRGPHPVERGTDSPLVLASHERTVEFTFTSPSFRAGETMRFQWRLVGSSNAWSPPGTMRAITCTGLAPGRYQFEVRAVDGEGQVSTPATRAFAIRPPLWQRGWFITLAALALAAGAAALYRARLTRLLEIERVRSRIATDLHDDIGASLSQIAVLSQVASRQAARGGTEAGGSLARITDLSGGVVDAMSDVVWSVNPARDHMSDLVHRMRRYAVDLFSETDVQLRLDLPDDDAGDARLDPESRREVYLVFKEALRNAVRHSAATSVEVRLSRDGGGLLLAVRDDGRGIENGASGGLGGQGLENMKRRAEAIGGALEVRPRPGGGTEVLLRTTGKTRRRRRLITWTGPGAGRAR